MAYSLRPITLKEAKKYVQLHHRHNKPPVSWLFGVGLEVDGELVGVAIAGRPVSRHLDDGKTVEITRVATNGTKNANSCLYGSVLRAAKALGYCRAVTYTLDSESDATMRAVGFELDANLKARDTWNCKSRERYQKDLWGNDTRPPGPKKRWVKILNAKQRAEGTI